MIGKIEPDQLQKHMETVTGWQIVDQTYLKRSLTFGSFAAAIDFIRQVADEAERLNHHPDWSNSYKTVKIRLTTHSCQGLTRLDFALAAAIDRIWARFSP